MSRIRLIFTGIILLFLIGSGTAWVLSNQGIFQSSWAPSLGIAFSVLGVLVAFVQWTIPLPTSDPKTSTESAKSSHAREIFFKQIQDRLTGGTGALVVYVKGDNVGKNISASHGSKERFEQVKANIVERMVNGYPLFAAVFPGLKPDTYFVSGPNGDSASITVFSEQTAEVDWRKNIGWEEQSRLEKKAKQRKKSQAALRVRSVMIGLGGVFFLVHRFMMFPYFDAIGIILMSWGVVNLLSSSILDWLGWLQGDDGNLTRFGLLVAELGGVFFFAHKYIAIPYLDIAGIVLMILGAIWLIGWLLAT